MFKKALAIACVLSMLASPAMARPRHGDHGQKRHVVKNRDHGNHAYRRHQNTRHLYRNQQYRRYHNRPNVYWRAGRPWYGYAAPYRGHRHYRHVDDDVFLWLGLTAIGLTAIHALNQAQQRRYDAAHWQAADAPIGRTITWREGGASGTVTPLREGVADDGQYCREFQREVQIDGRTERAYGTACLQEDGSWKTTR